MNSIRKLIISRWITRIGDHAWDLALPLALIQVFPGTLRPIAIYYLLTRLSVILIMPSLGAWSDSHNRLRVIALGIFLQTMGVGGVAVLLGTSHLDQGFMMGVIVISGSLSQLGGSLMNVAVPSDWIPTLLRGKELATVNSRLKRVDLISEVAAPLAAGAIMTIGSLSNFFTSGFFFIAALNILSFLPEYLLLRSVYNRSLSLQLEKHRDVLFDKNFSRFFKNIAVNAHAVLKHYLAPVIIANSLLWFTVLTPHGILLTAYLKESWHLSDTLIGVFRSLGALSGIIPTFIYDRMVKRYGIKATAFRFVLIQSVTLVGASLLLHLPYIFLILIVISRIGLYGFSLSEIHLRQQYVESPMRGMIGGFATSLNYAMTLLLYLIALGISDPASFPILCYLSCGAILAAMLSVGWFVFRNDDAHSPNIG